MDIEQKLVWVFEDHVDAIRDMKAGTEEHSEAVDSMTKIADRILEFEKLKQETLLAEKTRKDELKDRRNRTVIEIVKIGVPTTAACVMGLVSMVWEKTDTLTLTAGKSSLRDVLKFKI